MIAVIQRVLRASVKVDGAVVGECGHGLAILLGVARGDSVEDADKLMAKISKLRIFCDENGKMNLSVNDVGGSALVISQFTLLANYAKGNRPDYFNAAPPDEANTLYEYFCEGFEKLIPGDVGRGIFGADMECEFINNGPVTIVMDSKVLS
jgi:D-tyrosyl-tRNA(Tyr) deacylase